MPDHKWLVRINQQYRRIVSSNDQVYCYYMVQFPLDNSELSPQQEDLEILSMIGVVTQQDNFDQS
jgi:hypothetical protein